MRAVRVTLTGVLAWLALVACASEPTLANPVATPPPPVSAVPSSDGPVTYFYGLGLHLGSSWVQAEEEGDLPRAVVVEADCTQQPQIYCSGFAVTLLDQDPAIRPDLRLENGCWSNGVTDDRYYGFPKYVGTVTIDGQPAEYFKYLQCSRDTGEPGPEVMHMWRIVTKGVVVFDLNLGGKQPTHGLESLLAGASWQA